MVIKRSLNKSLNRFSRSLYQRGFASFTRKALVFVSYRELPESQTGYLGSPQPRIDYPAQQSHALGCIIMKAVRNCLKCKFIPCRRKLKSISYIWMIKSANEISEVLYGKPWWDRRFIKCFRFFSIIRFSLPCIKINFTSWKKIIDLSQIWKLASLESRGEYGTPISSTHTNK